MKVVLAVGAAGDMGRVASRTAAEDPAIGRVVIADRDGERAAAVADAIGAKASSLELDISDHDALLDALGEADFVMNTVGPFYTFGPPVLEAAIEARVHYVDINDDWEPTLEMLELHDRARAVDIAAIIGIGASPGVTNLLAAVAARELDVVRRLFTGWRAGAGLAKPTAEDPAPEASAAVDHWVHNCAAPIRSFRAGGFTDVEPLEELMITYPERGTGSVWTCGHPEPVTLPRTFSGLDDCMNVMVSRPGLIAAMRRVAARVRSGELDVHQGANALLVEPDRRGPAAGEPAPFPDVFALAEGTRDGREMRVGVTTNVMPDQDMGAATGIPLAIAAGMLARGEVNGRGVMAPEMAIDPALFFERLAPFAPKIRDGERLAIVSEAVEPMAT